MRADLNASAHVAVLSHDSIAKNKSHHADLDLANYRTIPAIAEDAALIFRPADGSLIFVREDTTERGFWLVLKLVVDHAPLVHPGIARDCAET